MQPAEIDEAVRRADLDELIRLIDDVCSARDWDGLVSLRERCARAHETGRQLWPAASHAAYRLALEAPAAYAAATLDAIGAPFTLGPLSEVAAQAHTWSELAPHAPNGAPAVLAANERVLRGEDLTDLELPGPSVLEVSLRLEDWEPDYALAEYHSDRAEFPMPAIPALQPVTLPAPNDDIERDEASGALVELVRAWTAGSDGRADAVSVRGDALDAIAALGPHAARVASIEPALGLAIMAWAGASGGAHGRRAGAAAGRFGAWWALGAMTGLLDDWPPHPDDLGDALGSLEFVAWDSEEPETGWKLHLAVATTAHDRAWAVTASDAD
ncbi:MAG: hypothetical protein EXQ79_02965 [Acidimicrobiia bacterium]|nr:hypothetical protein [Acidimicrobiia bacterium]